MAQPGGLAEVLLEEQHIPLPSINAAGYSFYFLASYKRECSEAR